MKTNPKWPKTQCFPVPAERPQIANTFSRSCESRSTHFSSFPVLCKTTTWTNLGNFKVSTTTWAHKNEALFIITSTPFEPIPCRILVPQCDWDEIIAKYSGRQRRVAHVLWRDVFPYRSRRHCFNLTAAAMYQHKIRNKTREYSVLGRVKLWAYLQNSICKNTAIYPAFLLLSWAI